MNTLKLIINILEYILAGYLGITVVYNLIYALAGLFTLRNRKATENRLRKIAVLIPGYKEDNVILQTAKVSLQQDYPKEMYEVIVIADSFSAGTLQKLSEMPIRVVEVAFENSTKSKALNKTMYQIPEDYDIAVILDADNLMADDFLTKINEGFNQGFRVIQGHRVAKNTDTSFAILDAISEEINNHIFRKGHRVLGLSSALIGSGMAFEYLFFKNMMADIKAIGGFDKELELKLLRDRQTIGYLENALVYDEKTQKADNFQRQRKRWLSAQFIYFSNYLGSGLKHLFLKGNIDFFDKVLQLAFLPRVLLLGVLFLCSAVSIGANLLSLPFIESNFVTSWLFWTGLFIVTGLTLLLSTPRQFFSYRTLKAISSLPRAFLLMFGSLFKLKGANKKFIHTVHGDHPEAGTTSPNK
ncbi:MAG: glycosyltransferase family 2 protein [Bacteroidota bacterium]|nr:glycosyltransferase family 2 protein [Bacteroidota bacterium]